MDSNPPRYGRVLNDLRNLIAEEQAYSAETDKMLRDVATIRQTVDKLRTLRAEVQGLTLEQIAQRLDLILRAWPVGGVGRG